MLALHEPRGKPRTICQQGPPSPCRVALAVTAAAAIALICRGVVSGARAQNQGRCWGAWTSRSGVEPVAGERRGLSFQWLRRHYPLLPDLHPNMLTSFCKLRIRIDFGQLGRLSWVQNTQKAASGHLWTPACGHL